jgi:twitching motility protein PilT
MMPSPLCELPFIDLYIRLDKPDRPLYRPMDRLSGLQSLLVPEDYYPDIQKLSAIVWEALNEEVEGAAEFEDLRFRLSKQRMADGSIWACARRISMKLPVLGELGFPSQMAAHLHGLGVRDGLIIVSGSTGQGKTTTAVALLADYLKTYGGTALTIEDPVEYYLKGRHGDFGQCFQVEVSDDSEWAVALKRSLRWSPRYIFVGEVRTPKAAEQLLRAATTGHLVITTMHAGSPEEAITGLLFYAERAMGPGAKDLLATSLTALVNQQLTGNGIYARYLYTEESAPGDPVRSLIREEKIGMLSTYIDRLSARLMNPRFLQDGKGGV